MRISDDCSAHCDPLTLTTRERSWVAIEQLSQPKNFGCAFYGGINFSGGFLGEHQAERHVLAHLHMRIQRVILEHHRDVTLFGLHLIHDGATDPDLARADFFEPGDHPQKRTFTAARWTNQYRKFAIGDLNIHASDHVG